MKQEWARWVLVVGNALASLAFACAMVLAWAAGKEHFVSTSSLSFTAAPLAGLSVLFGVLAHQQTQRRGQGLQTVVAVGMLGLAALLGWWPLVPCAGFALLTVWWLGDFERDARPLPAGTPHQVARFMWRRGDSYDAIRAEQAARAMPADELERLVYDLTLEEAAREKAGP